MLTFRKGTSATPTAAQAMSDHLHEGTLPIEMEAVADYYQRSVARAEAEGTAAMPRRDMPLAVADALGIDLTRSLRKDEVVNLLRGTRADGDAIAGKADYTVKAGLDRVTFVDFTWSAPKSVSLAAALAPTEAERHIIVTAHRDAVAAGMAHLETIVGHARKGHEGSKGTVPGRLGWVEFLHHTSRPTVELPHTEADGTKTTLIQSVRNPKVAGDMQLHTHVTLPNVVACDDGSVGSLDMLALHDRIHELGSLYQAHLAQNLRRQGIDVVLDARTNTARVAAVPQEITELFSKRTRDGEAAAREYAAGKGLDWDAMHPMEKAAAMKGGTRATRRQKETGQRGDDMTDLAAWKAQAKAAGYEHASVISQEVKDRPAPSEQERLTTAYKASLPILAREFESRATMYASVARTAAARGLIASGVESAADIDKITAAMRTHGVQQSGKQVPLMWGEAATVDAVAGGRRPRVKITTTVHVAQEEEAMRLASRAAADRSGVLQPHEIARAVAHVSARDGLDFTTEHGAEQRRVIDALGTSGRLAMLTAPGGAGKTTLLRPLVEAWTTPVPGVRPGREVYGTALAWRQAEPLADAGIKPENAMAIAALLTRAKAGSLALDHNAVVVVDELSQVSTKQALGLLRLQAEHGFSIVALGDGKQAQAIDAGNTPALLRKALGAGAVHEMDGTVRQRRDRDKETTLMFRQGDAAGGIARLREDGHAMLVPGGHRHAVEAVADLWEARRRENAGREGYTVTISAPTNADARAIGSAIRERRRKAGEVSADQVTIKATDQNRAEYDLPLAVGDRVRLFARTQAAFGGRGGNLGHNGSVVTVQRIEADGVQLRNAKGKGASGFVKWDTLRDPASGRVRLTYGDALTIDSAQGITSTDHINAMPAGSADVQSNKGYVGQSRARETTFLVVADGRERTEIIGRRALGNVAPITENDVWANVARNLSRQPEKELATDLLDRAREMHTGTVRSLATAFQPGQQRQATGGPPPDLRSAFTERQTARDVARQAQAVDTAAAQNGEATREVARRLTAPGEVRKAVQEARRSIRPPAARPKRGRAQPIITPTEAQAEFADALHRAGLRLPGAPIMDGQKHRVPVEGSSKSKTSGFYIGHLDGHPAGYAHNHQTGDEIRWKASQPTKERTPEERERARSQAVADQAAREAQRRRAEVAASHKALAIWNRAKPVQAHPYLTRKDVASHGLRQDRRGNLLVPMRDVDGRLWGLQTITPDGGKFYMADARRQGTHALLGDLQPGQPVMVLEGYATGATIFEVTGIATAVAFDSGNLGNVAHAYRGQDPARPIVFPSDNDHHLPRREKPLPNVGQVKAEAAAKEVGGVVLVPPFAPTDAGTDFNDFAAQHGRAAVRQIAHTELTRHGIKLPAAMVKQAQAEAVITQAARDAARQNTPARTTQAQDQTAREAARQRPQGLSM